VLDVMMPAVDGIEVARRGAGIGKPDSHPHVDGGATAAADVIRGLDAGC